jgi:translation initiation factor IF-2
MVTQGSVQRGAQVRIVRDGTIVHDGRIGTLKRFQEDVREVSQGFECGLTIDGYNDIKEGDVLEVYTVREVARSA